MLKILYFGTPDFAAKVLAALHLEPEFKIVAVYTQLDKRQGRGLKVTASPVKALASSLGLIVVQPETLRDEAVLSKMRSFNADVLVNVACGFWLPEAVLTMFKLGCVNVHPSLLPRWRGASPIQRAIMAGDEYTGVSIMQMALELDAGAIYHQERLKIEPTDNAGTLTGKLIQLSIPLLITTLKELASGSATAIEQSESGVTLAPKIEKEERVINWQQPSSQLVNLVHALAPDRLAYSFLKQRQWLIGDASINKTSQAKAAPGTILELDSSGLTVATSDGAITLTRLQPAGGKMLSAKEFFNAYRSSINVGACFN